MVKPDRRGMMRLDQAESASLGRKSGRKFVSEQTTYRTPHPMKRYVRGREGYRPLADPFQPLVARLSASLSRRRSRVRVPSLP